MLRIEGRPTLKTLAGALLVAAWAVGYHLDAAASDVGRGHAADAQAQARRLLQAPHDNERIASAPSTSAARDSWSQAYEQARRLLAGVGTVGGGAVQLQDATPSAQLVRADPHTLAERLLASPGVY